MTTGGPRGDRFVPGWLWLGVALIVALGIFFRFYHLDRKVLWEDEILGTIHAYGYTEAEIAAASPHVTQASDVQRYLEPSGSRGVASTIASLAAEDPQHPPVYYVVIHLWTQRFGGSPQALRMPAAIFAVLVLPCVFWLAFELFGSLTAALVAVALVAVSPFYVLYAQEAREYSLWTAAIALDAAIFLRAVRARGPAPGLWIAYGAVTAASLYIYPLTALAACGFAAYALIKDRGRLTRTVLACALATLAALALFAPWAKDMITSSGVPQGMAAILTSKLPPALVARIFARNIRLVFFDIGSWHLGPLSTSTLDVVLTLAAVALCAYAFVALVRTQPYSVWGFVVVGLCCSMMPLVLRDLLVHGNFVYQARYFLPLFLGAQLAVAALFARMLFGHAAGGATRAAGGLVLAAVLAGEVFSCAVASQATTWWNKDYERAPEVAAVVNSATKPLVVSNYFASSTLELSFYLEPGIPMRLDLKCANCKPAPDAGAAFPSDGYQNVFAVEAPNTARPARGRWIDPMPYPAQVRPLNMFTVVSTAN